MSNYGLADEQAVLSFDYSNWLFQEDRKNYVIYKTRSETYQFSEEQKLEMEVLSILEQLGFPMNQVGTYLYKNMVVKVVKLLDSIINKNNFEEEYKNLVTQLESPFSQFYVDIARNDLDLGVKSFHQYVTNAVENVKYSKLSSDLAVNFSTSLTENNNYRKHSIVIGSYILDQLSQKEKVVTFVKCLTVMPKCD